MLGSLVGSMEGSVVGSMVECLVGATEGLDVTTLGAVVGDVGLMVGSDEGLFVYGIP